MNAPDVCLEMVVEVREQLRKAGEYELADKIKEFLEKNGVLIEDGKRVVYLCDMSVEEFRDVEKRERDGKKRFLSWLNGQYKKLGYPLETYESFWQ